MTGLEQNVPRLCGGNRRRRMNAYGACHWGAQRHIALPDGQTVGANGPDAGCPEGKAGVWGVDYAAKCSSSLDGKSQGSFARWFRLTRIALDEATNRIGPSFGILV